MCFAKPYGEGNLRSLVYDIRGENSSNPRGAKLQLRQATETSRLAVILHPMGTRSSLDRKSEVLICVSSSQSQHAESEDATELDEI